MSSMRQVTIRREHLITTLRTNMKAHRDTFTRAQEGYREAVIKELDSMLRDAQLGNSIRRAVTWPEPVDHTSDYERAVLMLEMCIEDEIEITSEDFQELVMDNWGWKKNWTSVTSNYLGE